MLEDVSAAEIKKLASNAHLKTFAKDVYIFEAETPTENVYILINGLVGIYGQTIGPRSLMFYTTGPNEVFGESALTRDVYGYTAKTSETSQVLIISREVFSQVAMNSPPLAGRLLKQVSERLAAAYAFSNQMVNGDVLVRLVTFLLTLDPLRTRQPLPFPFKGGHKTLAYMLGTTRETISDHLRKLRKDGLIDYNRQTMTILDADRLKELLPAPGTGTGETK